MSTISYNRKLEIVYDFCVSAMEKDSNEIAKIIANNNQTHKLNQSLNGCIIDLEKISEPVLNIIYEYVATKLLEKNHR